MLLAVLTGFASTASAQDVGDQNGRIRDTFEYQAGLIDWDSIKLYNAERVRDRDRHDWAPMGFDSGYYLTLPKIASALGYDDNIRSPSGKMGDFYNETNASVVFQSEFTRHILDVQVGVRTVNYLENEEQDHADANARIGGRVDIDGSNALFAEYTDELTHKEVFDPDADLGADEPIPLHSQVAATGYVHDNGRIKITAGLSGSISDYDNITARNGQTLNENYRDLTGYGAYLRMLYRFSPGYSAFVGTGIDRKEYWDAISTHRDATRERIKVGVNTEIDPLLRLNLDVGYTFRDYDLASEKDFGSWEWNAEAQWLVTPLVTIYGNLGQSLTESSYPGSLGRYDTAVSMQVEYEMWRNLLWTANFDITFSDYLETDRSDIYWSAKIGGEYLVNNNLMFTLNYEHQQRDSTINQFDNEDNRYLIGLRLAY